MLLAKGTNHQMYKTRGCKQRKGNGKQRWQKRLRFIHSVFGTYCFRQCNCTRHQLSWWLSFESSLDLVTNRLIAHSGPGAVDGPKVGVLLLELIKNALFEPVLLAAFVVAVHEAVLVEVFLADRGLLSGVDLSHVSALGIGIEGLNGCFERKRSVLRVN